jgi:signal recognition particle GTPase
LGQSSKNSNLNGDNESMQLKQSLNDLNRELSNFKTQIENKQQTTADFANQAKQILIQQKIKETIADKMKEQLSNSNLNAAINSNLNAVNNIP